ncbi:MAG: PqqD family protein [Bacteroidales bacterium]|nr:PqqD family protein [Bacteroidales bacterium]MCF8402965.1 PqqD family protein [Bacteroidales bacterium]
MKIKQNIAISESGYVFNPSTGESFSINQTGVEIFNMLKEGKSYEEISAIFSKKYNADKDTFEKDYNDFTGILQQHLLVETENGQ